MVLDLRSEYQDRVSTTVQLHAAADAAAQRGDFKEALAQAAEILRCDPQDHRARTKAGLCLAALGRPNDGASALLLVARSLARRGFALASIGACRDALGLAAEHAGILPVLESLHERFGGLEGKPVPRTPPPIAPVEVASGPPVYRPDAPDLVERARALAVSDPDAVGAPEESEAQPVPFFSDLGRDAFLDLVRRLSFLKIPPGYPVVKQGDPGGSLFIIVSGEVAVTLREEDRSQELATLGPGHLFGEMSLLTQKPRTASVTSTRPTELFEVDRAALEAVARRHPAIVEDLVRFARRRMISNLLGTSPLFRPLGPEERKEVVAAFETDVAKKGEVLITRGEHPAGLYLVLEGELEVMTADEEGDEVVLAYLREGQVVGEISVLAKEPATATVTASERSVVLRLPRERFDALVAAHPALATYLEKLSSARLEETEAASAEGLALDADELVLM